MLMSKSWREQKVPAIAGGGETFGRSDNGSGGVVGEAAPLT